MSRRGGQFLDRLELVKPDAQTEELKKIGKAIRGVPVGPVAGGVEDRFQVPPGLPVKNPGEAARRFAALRVAMKANAGSLSAQPSRPE